MSDKKKTTLATKVITGKGRLSYAYVWSPHKSDDDDEAKYSTRFMIPKEDTDTVRKIKAAIKAAADIGMKKYWGGELPKKFKIPLRDGDLEADEKSEELRGHWFFNATSNRAPGIVDAKRRPITDEDEVYSGCYARLSINMFPFDTKGSKGVGCGLNNIQKLEDGEHLGGGRTKAEDDFDDWGDANGDLFGDANDDDDLFGDLGKERKPSNDLFDDEGDLPFGPDDDIAA